MRSRSERRIILGIALSFFLSAAAWVLILPPYEGFDESGHYSAISFLADRGRVPDMGRTPLDWTTAGEVPGLPAPYAARPPYDRNGGLTYRDFFADANAPARAAALETLHRAPRTPASYKPGPGLNWQAQHPPLYYAVMVLPYKLAASLSPSARILVLRMLSLCWVLAGFGVVACMGSLMDSDRARQALLTGAALLLFMPSFYSDMARLGNDSLGSFLFACVLYFLLKSVKNRQQSLADFFWLGFFLGLGLLTKLYFLPVLAAAAGISFLAARQQKTVAGPAFCARLLLLLAAAAGVSTWWFVFFYRRHGLVFGEQVLLEWQAGGFALKVRGLQILFHWLRLAGAMMESFLWAGSWSWVRRPLWHFLLWVPAAFCLIAGARKTGRETPGPEERQLLLGAVLMLGTLAAGYAVFMLVIVLTRGAEATAAGHYFYVFWPCLSLLSGWIIKPCFYGRAKGILLAALAGLVVFELLGWWQLMNVYAGFLVKSGALKAGTGGLRLTPSNWLVVMQRLKGFVWPYAAHVLLGAGIVLRFAVLSRFGKLRNTGTPEA